MVRVASLVVADAAEETLRTVSAQIIGDELSIDLVLKAATGRFAAGAAAPFNVAVAVATARSAEVVATDPVLRSR